MHAGVTCPGARLAPLRRWIAGLMMCLGVLTFPLFIFV